jgi:N6-L-threonylcarbamoyladenine synthase
MKILGIETSCDETAAAIVEKGTKILSNVVASSVQLHRKTGGIIPEVAAREQVRFIIPVIEKALKSKIDAIAVTVGPGLIGSLLVGVETARTLAFVLKKPIIPVNHLLAHIYANFLESNPKFPLVALVVSGGHTDLVLMKNHGQIHWLGGTRDDAAGECFDKCARILGLDYPGGPAIAAEAAKLKVKNEKLKLKIKLPRPMREEKNFDFSFSGLKTAVLREVERLKNNQQYNNLTIQHLSFEIQEAITDVLVEKTVQAAKKYKVKSILLAGGVAANSRLREKFHLALSSSSFSLYLPLPSLCTDNAAYVSSFAYFNYKPLPWEKISAQPGLSIAGEV